MFHLHFPTIVDFSRVKQCLCTARSPHPEIVRRNVLPVFQKIGIAYKYVVSHWPGWYQLCSLVSINSRYIIFVSSNRMLFFWPKWWRKLTKDEVCSWIQLLLSNGIYRHDFTVLACDVLNSFVRSTFFPPILSNKSLESNNIFSIFDPENTTEKENLLDKLR